MPFARLRKKQQKSPWTELSSEHLRAAVEQYLWSMRMIKDTQEVTEVYCMEESPHAYFRVRREVSGK